MRDGSSELNQQFRLANGRMLGFAAYGDPAGRLLFYFHGWPGSRFEPRLLSPLCAELGMRLIAPDRPGYGLSDFQRGRRLIDWPEDVCELAEHLGATRFAVLGVSGGGPYAMACAAMIPERLSALLLVCSVAPLGSPDMLEGMVALNRWLLRFARAVPWLAERVAGLCLRIVWKHGEQVIPAQIEKRLPKQDKLALQNLAFRETLIASSVEALRNGARAAAADGVLLAKPWGFDLENIPVPAMLWHGESDVVVPPVMGHWLARRLPLCHPTFYPEDGHFSLPYNRAKEILETIPER